MNNRVINTMLGMLSALLLVEAVPSFAATDQDTGLSEVVVTARRFEERLQDVPISISVFNQQQLNNLNVVFAQDLANYTPSLQVNNNFGNLNTAFAIRGFVQDIGTQPAVGVYFADVISPRGSSNNQQIGDGAGPGNFFDLQNVEVLKGPQSTLFGRNTTGGSILLVPQKPTSKEEGYLEYSYGNYAMNRVQGVINLPLSDTLRFRAGIDHQTRQGYETNISAISNTAGSPPVRFGDVDYTALRASLVADLTPNLENYTIATYLDSDVNGDVQKLVGCSLASLGPFACLQMAAEAAHGIRFYDLDSTLPNPYTHLTQWQAINTTTWTASDALTVKNIASYAQLSERYRNSIFGTNFSLGLLGVPPPFNFPFDFAASVPLPGGYTADESTLTEELQAQGRAMNDRLHWQTGAYEENVEPLSLVGSQSPVLIDCANSDTFNCIAPIGSPPGGVNYTAGKQYFNNFGAYEQATYGLTDVLKLTEGLRFTWDQTHANSQLITNSFPNPFVPFVTKQSCTNPNASLPACSVHFQENSNAPTWLLGLDYTPNDNMLVYGKYTRGYRAGGVASQAPSEFATYQPEKVDTYELGLKTTFHAVVSGTFNADVFYNNFRDQQLQLNLNPKPGAGVSPASATLNAGKSRIYGAEIETSLLLFEGFTLATSYTYLDTRVQEITPVVTPANSPYDVVSPVAVGDALPLSPKNKVSTTATYQLPIPEHIGKIAASVTFTHTGTMVTNYVDATSTNPQVTGLGTLPALNLLNANVNWNSIMGTRLSASIFGSNLGNKTYYTYVPGLIGTVGFETAELGQPRLYGVRLRYTFGRSEAPAAAAPPPPPTPAPPPPPPPPPAKPASLCPDTPPGVVVDQYGCPCDVSQEVHFATDSATLTDQDKALLDKVIANLHRLPFVDGEVGGYTDATGRAAYNQGLSERRAQAVVDYLVSHGISTHRLTAKGYGEENPVADNNTAEGRAHNRRVVLHRTNCGK